MCLFFAELLKYEPSIIVVSLTSPTQLILSKDLLPMNKTDFKSYVAVTMDTQMTTSKKQQLLIGCKLLSNCTFNDIKFDSNKPQFMAWLSKEKIFVKSNSLYNWVSYSAAPAADQPIHTKHPAWKTYLWTPSLLWNSIHCSKTYKTMQCQIEFLLLWKSPFCIVQN